MYNFNIIVLNRCKNAFMESDLIVLKRGSRRLSVAGIYLSLTNVEPVAFIDLLILNCPSRILWPTSAIRS